MTEALIRNLMIQEIKARLASCEKEQLALAREVLSSSTPTDRRIDALIDRAALQTESVSLLRKLQDLEFRPMRRAQEPPLEDGASNLFGFPFRPASLDF